MPHPLEQLAALAPADLTPAALLYEDLDTEFASTRRLLERYPEEHAEWRPHERSTTLGALAAHVARLPQFAVAITETPELDLAARPYQPPVERTTAGVLAAFDAGAARAREVIQNLDFATAAGTWTFRHGDHVIFSDRRGPLLRRFLLSHIAHHRGQLSVYYRLLGVPVPGMYGPSADGD